MWLLVLVSVQLCMSTPIVWTAGINIIQSGVPRTASTFQFELLCGCALVKAQALGLTVSCQFDTRNDSADINVIKTHHYERRWRNVANQYLFVSVPSQQSAIAFRSKPMFSDTLLFQVYSDFILRTISTILDYVPVFELSSPDIGAIHEYLRYWQIVRRCCGSQASYDWRLELHNSSKRPHHSIHALDSMDCHLYKLDEVEKRVRESLLCVRFPHCLDCVHEGYCAETLGKLRDGFDFNGNKWRGK